MERDRFPLATSREPNPLRPYHIPPSVGNVASSASSQFQTSHTGCASVGATSNSLGSSARDVFPDLDIDLKSTTSEAWQHTRRILDTLAWRFTSVVLAQPFDVAKTLMQVSLPSESVKPGSARSSRKSSRHSRRHEETYSSTRHRESGYSYETHEYDADHISDASDEMPDYFSSAAPRSRSPRRKKRASPTALSSPSPTPTPRNRREPDLEMEYKLRLRRVDSINHVLSALYTTSGAVGWWRATNCTFLYSILLRTTDSFIRSLLLAVLGLPEIAGPDPAGLGPNLSVIGTAGFSGLDLSASPNIFSSLVVVGLSSCITGILLAPLDMVRTHLVITPTFSTPRGLVQNLRRLPSLVAPSILWMPTALYHGVPQVFSAVAPLIIRRQLRVSPELTPSVWSLASFTTSMMDLFVRLPLETVVRRAQAQALKQLEPDLMTIVDPAPYTGVWATVYAIMYTEGEVTTKDSKGMIRTRRGHGASGLIRGWRIGFWGLVGVWGAGAMGPGDGRGRGQF